MGRIQAEHARFALQDVTCGLVDIALRIGVDKRAWCNFLASNLVEGRLSVLIISISSCSVLAALTATISFTEG